MRHTIIICTLMLFGCGTKTPDSKPDTSTEAVKTEAAGKKSGRENFENFFERFKSDSLFQVERVRFPLTLKSWDFHADRAKTDQLKSKDWKFIRFEYEDENAYTQEKKIYGDSATFELRGLGSFGNGTLIDYNFSIINERWFLISEKDFSDY